MVRARGGSRRGRGRKTIGVRSENRGRLPPPEETRDGEQLGRPEPSDGRGRHAAPVEGDEYDDDEGEFIRMVERDMMAGPALGVVRYPLYYGAESEDGRGNKPGCRNKFIEFACDPQSRFSDAVAAWGVETVRVHRKTYDILDEGSMNELSVIIADGDCDMWGALACLPWRLFCSRHFQKRGVFCAM